MLGDFLGVFFCGIAKSRILSFIEIVMFTVFRNTGESWSKNSLHERGCFACTGVLTAKRGHFGVKKGVEIGRKRVQKMVGPPPVIFVLKVRFLCKNKTLIRRCPQSGPQTYPKNPPINLTIFKKRG